MVELSDIEISAALQRGSVARGNEPRAISARFDTKSGNIIVVLTNGCTFTFPPRIAQGLENANAGQLAKIEILGAGYGLHWEQLDVDLYIQGLLAGIFGTRSYMAGLAGRASSPAKAAAARANGAKGGRPRKTA